MAIQSSIYFFGETFPEILSRDVYEGISSFLIPPAFLRLVLFACLTFFASLSAGQQDSTSWQQSLLNWWEGKQDVSSKKSAVNGEAEKLDQIVELGDGPFAGGTPALEQREQGAPWPSEEESVTASLDAQTPLQQVSAPQEGVLQPFLGEARCLARVASVEKSQNYRPLFLGIRAHLASSSRMFSYFLFRRTHHPVSERESFWGSLLFSSLQKQEEVCAERGSLTFGGEKKTQSGLLGAFSAYQYTNLESFGWRGKVKELGLGFFGSCFEEFPLYLSHSFLASGFLAQCNNLREKLCSAKGFSTNEAIALNLDLCFLGAPFIQLWVKGDLFFSSICIENQTRTSISFSRGVGGLFSPTFFSFGSFFSPYFCLSYSQQPNLSTHIFSPEVGLKIGDLRGNSFLEIVLRGEFSKITKEPFFHHV